MRNKILIITIGVLLCIADAFAQSRAVGVRVGVCGLEASYEHSFSKTQFLEGNLGLDFGNKVNGAPGIKAEGTYNFIWARPAWTNKGSWAIYSGPGASIGYVNDEVHFKELKEVVSFEANGFMLGISVQVGLEYTFEFPMQLSLDLRPVIGMHITGKHPYTDPANPEILRESKAKIGFYDNGLLGFAPSISIRYRF